MNSPAESDVTCTLSPSGGGRCELSQNLETLRTVPVFAPIPLEKLKLYAYLSRRVCYRAGDFLFRTGDLDDRGYIILSGRAQVIRDFLDHSILLDELKEGDFFGGLALLGNTQRLFAVKALTDLECLTLDRASFRKLLTQFPEVAIQVLDLMIQRVVEMEEKLLKSQETFCLMP